MELILILLSFLAPDPKNLGVDSWEAREAWSARYSNPICSALLPASHEDPEIDFRLKAIHRTHSVEPLVKRQSYSLWIRLYVLDGDSGVQGRDAVFYELHTDGQRATAFFAIAPVSMAWEQSWLRSHVLLGEFEKFQAHILAYRKSKGK